MSYFTKIIMFSGILVTSYSLSAKKLAITFDDAPRPDTSYFNSAERNERLLNALNKHHVTAMFFITTKNMQAGREQRLLEYTKSNQLLANHTHSHDSADKTAAPEFLADVTKAHQILKTYKNYYPYFRFPYLHHGDTKAKLNDTIPHKEVTTQKAPAIFAQGVTMQEWSIPFK